MIGENIYRNTIELPCLALPAAVRPTYLCAGSRQKEIPI